MSYVVTTPTGHIGSRIVQLLIQSGVRPTLLVRDPAKLDPHVREASEVKQGNLADAEFVAEATAGAQALFWLIPVDYQSDDPLGDIVQLGRNAAAAIEKNRIGRTILLSSAGADRRGQDFISALGRVEDILNATAPNVLSLRPGYFFTNLFMNLEALQQGVLPTTIPVDLPMPWNDPRDIGDIAAARVLSRDWSGQSVQHIHGPAHLTFAEVAEIVTTTTGKRIQAVQITDEEERAALLGAGFKPATADAFVEMSVGIREGSTAQDKRNFVSTTPTALAAWSYAHLRPVLNAG